MNIEKIQIFSEIFRAVEAEVGTSELTTIVLESLIVAVEDFRSAPEEFEEEFKRLLDIICSTEPKFGILNFHFVRLSLLFEEQVFGKKLTDDKWKKIVIDNVKDILKNTKEERAMILSQAEKLDIEGKTILIHDHSHTVQDVLVHYRKLKKHFRVVIAEQDYEKTHDNIDRMHAWKIPFQVVPAYMISHMENEVDMAFFGALTLKDTMHFVMDPGSHGVISEFHLAKVPVYVFINTNKFSLWKSRPRGEIFVHKQMRSHFSRDVVYERLKYSHDRVPLELFSKVITNEGIFAPDEVKDVFARKLKDQSEWCATHGIKGGAGRQN